MHSTFSPLQFYRKRRHWFPALSIILSATITVVAQDLDMNCMPITAIPPECQQIANDLAAREDSFRLRIELLEEQFNEAPPRERRRLRDRIRALERQRSRDPQILRLRRELQTCRAQFDTVPRRPLASAELDASFSGRATVTTTHGQAGGPFGQNLTLGIRFSRNRCVVTITSFPAIRFQTTPTPIGRVNVTVTQSGGGTGMFFPVTGQLVIPVSLHFRYDTIFATDDDASMTLTTGSSVSSRGAFSLTGTPLNTVNGTTQFGAITLVGTTVFQNGFLAGNDGGFTVAGQIGPPIPATPPPLCPRNQKCCERSDDGRRCMRCVPRNAVCP